MVSSDRHNYYIMSDEKVIVYSPYQDCYCADNLLYTDHLHINQQYCYKYKKQLK